MTALEDRLRAAMQEAARIAPEENPTPLRLTERRGVRARLSRRWLTLATPLAAAAAMAGIISGIVAVRTEQAMTRLPHASPAALAVLPPYEVALTYTGQLQPWLWRTDAVVASTTTGRRIATIKPPAPYNSFVAVSGSADGRRYVLAARHLSANYRAPQSPTQFYELRVHPHAVTLTALPTPILRALTFGDMALSPDGTKLAVTGSGPFPGSDAGVRIYDLATGRLVQAWGVTPPPTTGKCCAFGPASASPSWEANGRYLALDVSLAHCQDCVMLLDTHASGTSVQAVGRVILRTHNRHYLVIWTSTLIAPDGSQVLRSALSGSHSQRMVPYINRYSARSGRLVFSLPSSLDPWRVVWSSSNGRTFVVVTAPRVGPGQAEIYWAGKLATLPLPARSVTVAW